MKLLAMPTAAAAFLPRRSHVPGNFKLCEGSRHHKSTLFKLRVHLGHKLDSITQIKILCW
jgi:hypothetical protein